MPKTPPNHPRALLTLPEISAYNGRMFTTLFFDLDDTILDFCAAERRALTHTLQDVGVTPTDEILSRYSEINLSQWKRLEKGEITRQEVKEGRYRLLFAEYGIAASPVETTAIYEKYLACGHIFMQGAQRLLDDLYGKYDMYIVSNGTLSVQKGRIASADIAKYFKGIFISEQIGADKPDKAFFDKCFAQIADFNPKNAVIIGDSLSSDIQGGINAGIATVWYNPRGGKPTVIFPDYEISDLAELKKILAENE